jgi:hypothetical protein
MNTSHGLTTPNFAIIGGVPKVLKVLVKAGATVHVAENMGKHRPHRGRRRLPTSHGMFLLCPNTNTADLTAAFD